MSAFQPVFGKCRDCGRFLWESYGGQGVIPEDWGDFDPETLCNSSLDEERDPQCYVLAYRRANRTVRRLRARVRYLVAACKRISEAAGL